MSVRFPFFALLVVAITRLSSGTTPVVTVSAPGNGASVGSPVNYIASASSSACSKGIATMRIYTAPGLNAYTVKASKLNTNINLPKGTFNTVVQAWDKCGGVGKAAVKVTVSSIRFAPAKFLYATEFKAGRIAEYVVDPLTGSLKPTAQGSTWAHWGPVDIASDHWGTRLYVANQGSHDLNAYSVDRRTGNLAQIPGSPFALAGVGHRAVVHPSGKLVYATSQNGTSTAFAINGFSVQSDGSLHPVPGSPFVYSGSWSMAIDPKGRYLYASSQANGVGAIAAYAINQTDGALTPISGSPFIVPLGNCDPNKDFCQQGATDIVVDPQSKYVYAALGIESALAGFAIDQTTGALSNLPGSPYPEANPPSGNFCPFSAFGACPYSWTASIVPSGKFIYVSDSQFNDISIFKINTATGVPSFAATSGNTQGGVCVPYTVNADPSGTFVYSIGITSNGCSSTPGTTNAVLGFSINQGSGQVTPVPGSPFANSNVHTTAVSEEKVLVTR